MAACAAALAALASLLPLLCCAAHCAFALAGLTQSLFRCCVLCREGLNGLTHRGEALAQEELELKLYELEQSFLEGMGAEGAQSDAQPADL